MVAEKKISFQVVKKERRETVDEGEVPIMTGPPPVPSHGKQEQEHDQGKKKIGLHYLVP